MAAAGALALGAVGYAAGGQPYNERIEKARQEVACGEELFDLKDDARFDLPIVCDEEKLESIHRTEQEVTKTFKILPDGHLVRDENEQTVFDTVGDITEAATIRLDEAMADQQDARELWAVRGVVAGAVIALAVPATVAAIRLKKKTAREHSSQKDTKDTAASGISADTGSDQSSMSGFTKITSG